MGEVVLRGGGGCVGRRRRAAWGAGLLLLGKRTLGRCNNAERKSFVANNSLLLEMETGGVRLEVADARTTESEISDDIQLLAPHEIARRPFPGWLLKRNRPCTMATVSTMVSCVLLMLVIFCFLRPQTAAEWPPLDPAPSDAQKPCTTLPSAAISSMYPAVRARAASIIRSIDPSLPRNTWAVLIGGQDSSLGYSDTEVPFRQESNFLYLTGWNMSGAIAMFSVDDGSLHLLLQVRCSSASD